jgi:hypothetical protein
MTELVAITFLVCLVVVVAMVLGVKVRAKAGPGGVDISTDDRRDTS